MKKVLLLLTIGLLLASCSTTVDTSKMSADEYLNYAMSLYKQGDYQQAINEFQSIILQYPGNKITDDAQYYLGMSYFKSGQYLLAAYQFSKLIKDFSGSNFVPDAQFQLAESYYKLSPPYQLDQTYTKKAIEEFQAFIDFFPTNPKVKKASARITELHNKLALKEYMAAIIYEKMEYYRAAIIYFSNVIKKFHDTKYAELSLYHKIKLLVLEDENTEALHSAETYLRNYPQSTNAKAVKQIKEELEKKTNG